MKKECAKCKKILSAKSCTLCKICYHKRGTNPIERFWKYVKKTDSCWLWMGGLHSAGYGGFKVTGSKTKAGTAHRFSYELHNGEIPEHKCVLHLCDMRPCVNPSHLFLGTRGDNARDRHAKGRDTKGDSAPWSILSEDIVKQMRELHLNGHPCDKIAKQFGVKYITAYQAIKRINWKHVHPDHEKVTE